MIGHKSIRITINQEGFVATAEAATGGVVQKNCSYKFRKVYRKTLMINGFAWYTFQRNQGSLKKTSP